MSTNGPTSGKPTIVLIHGLWLTPRSWEGWIDRYQKAGYNVLAPSWSGANAHARGQFTLDDVKAAFVPERPYQMPTSPDIRA